MPYNSLITRSDAAALIPQTVSQEIINELAVEDWLLGLARRLPDMSSSQHRLPVLNAMATAYFVNGDTGLKQTTELDWTNKYIDAEEIAAIVPIPEAVLDDANYDIWGQVKAALKAAFSKTISQAVLYGTNIPSSWTTNLGAAGVVAAATAASNTASAAGFTDMYEAILGESAAGAGDGVLMKLEADGFIANGHVAAISMMGRLRNTRATSGEPIFSASMQGPTDYRLSGAPIYFPNDGSIVASSGLLISGDWSKLVYAVRQDMTYKVLDQAVIQDNAGNIIYNLAQQDMVALRAVMRLGFALPNAKNPMNTTDATRCPFCVLTA